jgi:HAD superfamily hydrolase (TIGR01458 family)
MKAILFDLDGVFYQGEKPIAGASHVAAWVKDQGIPHLFITNTSSRPRSALVDKLAHFDIFTDEAHILTPPVAAVRWLQSQQNKGNIALFLPELTKDEFKDLPLLGKNSTSEISAIVIGDLGEKWNFSVLNQIFRYLMSQPAPTFITLGMTRYWLAEDGLRLDVAPFAIALEYASGIKPLIMGKPAKTFYQTALDSLQVTADETLMVGDDIRGDIEGAQLTGLKAALVKTGKFRPADLEKNIKPDVVFDSINDLPKWWEENTINFD